MNQYYFSTVEVFFLLWNIIVFIVFGGGGEGTAAKVKFSVVTNCISMENVYLLSTKLTFLWWPSLDLRHLPLHVAFRLKPLSYVVLVQRFCSNLFGLHQT